MIDVLEIIKNSGAKVKEGVLLSSMTSFRVGGKADYVAEPVSKDSVVSLINALRQNNIEYIILGNGTNVLAGDKGYRGVVVVFGEGMGNVEIEGNTISACAGALLSKTANAACEAGLSGLEFAAGIPGSVGGACIMNAGAYGGEIKDVIVSADVLKSDGSVVTLCKDEFELRYRGSSFSDEGDIVLGAKFVLENDDPKEIRQRIEELARKRREKQPLNFPSAGSTFKRPKDNFAGKLIQDAGLMGKAIGGAAVSDKHAGFIVNTGGATAADLKALIDYVKDVVYEQSGIMLEPEVRYIGEF